MATIAVPDGFKSLLNGIKVIEIAGLAPVPFCGMILADFGADVTLVRNVDNAGEFEQRLVRNKKILWMNLRDPEMVDRLKGLCYESDVLLDPYRPGILEKIGLCPVKLLEVHEQLIVVRVTGYGQFGEMAAAAGHDINYVSMSGILPIICGKSVHDSSYWPPANLLADFAGGGLLAAFSIMVALHHRDRNNGQGRIIDLSMTEGVAYLSSFISIYQDLPTLWKDKHSLFSANCPIYRTYKTLDGKFIAVGALEPKFRNQLFKTLNVDFHDDDLYGNPEKVSNCLEKIFKAKPRDEWAGIFKGVDACTTPVLELHEVGDITHHQQRTSFRKDGDKWIPCPAPRFYTKDEFRLIQKNNNSVNDN